jgi:uncharacterized protein YjbI with pentapeptide repeats
MSETMTGAELARLILRSGATAVEVAAMDLESLTGSVAYRRQQKIPSGAVSPSMTDEQIARAILEYAQSDPGDWPVAPRATTWKRACGAGLLGALGGGVGAVVFVVVGMFVVQAWYKNVRYFGEYLLTVAFFGAILGTPLAAILGAPLALVVARVKAGTGRLKHAILPLATGLAVGFIIAAGFWLWQLASLEGVFDRLNHKSADTLIERYQAGVRKFNGWNLHEEYLSGADLSGADLSGANLSKADLSGADLSGADLSEADLDYANLSRAKLSEAKLHGAGLFEVNLSKADLRGADLSGADLRRADLSGADLSGADLSKAFMHSVRLSGADLSEADLSEADLAYADLSGTIVYDTDLNDADLSGAKVTDEQLGQARSLVGATMPDGSVHE